MFAVNGRFQAHRLTGMQRYAVQLVSRFSQPPHIIAPEAPLKGLLGHLWEQAVLPSLLGSQLLWSPCGTGPLAVSRQVVTIHDIIPVDCPEWFSRRFAALHAWLIPRLARRVHRIIAVSQYTKQRLIERFGIRPQRIAVIGHGVGEEFSPRPGDEIAGVRQTCGIPDGPYVLSVCSLEPRKNLKRLLEAWAKVERGRNVSLVVTGAKGASAVFREACFGAVPKSVIFTGYVAEENLPALYSGAACFVYPSLYEGFGLPILEAAACGAPVVTSNVTSIPEICGPSATLVDPRSVAEIVSAICGVIDHPERARALAQAGRAYAASHSWTRCAAQTEQMLESV